MLEVLIACKLTNEAKAPSTLTRSRRWSFKCCGNQIRGGNLPLSETEGGECLFVFDRTTSVPKPARSKFVHSKRTHTHTQGYYAEHLSPQPGNKLKFSFAFALSPPPAPSAMLKGSTHVVFFVCGVRRVRFLNIVSGGREAGLAQN